MAGRTDASDKDCNFSFVSELFTERFRQIFSVPVIVRIADISNSPAAFSRIGAGKCHDLYSGIHQLVNNRRNDALIRNIHADHIVVLFFRRHESPDLVFGRSPLRCHVLIRDGDSPVQILSLGFFHPQCNRVPPGMDCFIRKIKIITVLQRLIRIKFMVKVHRAAHRFSRTGWHLLFRSRIRIS